MHQESAEIAFTVPDAQRVLGSLTVSPATFQAISWILIYTRNDSGHLHSLLGSKVLVHKISLF